MKCQTVAIRTGTLTLQPSGKHTGHVGTEEERKLTQIPISSKSICMPQQLWASSSLLYSQVITNH